MLSAVDIERDVRHAQRLIDTVASTLVARWTGEYPTLSAADDRQLDLEFVRALDRAHALLDVAVA